MLPNMVFNDFGHKTIYRTPGSRDKLQDLGTTMFPFQRALDCLDLPANSPNAVKKFRFFPCRMVP
jgi:hypothetical protein